MATARTVSAGAEAAKAAAKVASEQQRRAVEKHSANSVLMESDSRGPRRALVLVTEARVAESMERRGEVVASTARTMVMALALPLAKTLQSAQRKKEESARQPVAPERLRTRAPSIPAAATAVTAARRVNSMARRCEGSSRARATVTAVAMIRRTIETARETSRTTQQLRLQQQHQQRRRQRSRGPTTSPDPASRAAWARRGPL